MKEWFNKIMGADSISKIHAFLVAAIWVFGVVGGSSYMFFLHIPQFGVASILVGLMALPYVVAQFNKLLE